MTGREPRAAAARARAPQAILAVLALLLASLTVAAPAQAITWGPKLCNGFADCSAKGYGSSGYDEVYRQSFWYMTAGHNCTNYVAYRMQSAGTPRFGYGDAWRWGSEARRLGLNVDRSLPRPGDIAWWDRNAIGGSGLGHVAYVESVNAAAGTFTVSEDNYSADFDWRMYRISEVSGFIHVAKPAFAASPIPWISGDRRIGSTLTAHAGTWSPADTTLSYQWIRDGVWIKGAKAPTYTIAEADVGTRITVKVTGARSGYTTTSRWSGAVAVPLQTMTATPVPAVEGALAVGSTLTARTGTWSPSGVTLAYQWIRDGVWIRGAQAPTYTLSEADVGTRISVKVTGSRPYYATVSRWSPGVDVPLHRLTSTPTPRIVGTARLDATLTVEPGTWAPDGVTLRYQWIRNDTWIRGATGATYTVTPADTGTRLSVKVTGTKEKHQTVSRWAQEQLVPVEALTATPRPRIAGSPSVGGVLTADPGAWAPDGVTLRYQWIRDDVWIRGATGPTYTVAAADAGARIAVKVTGSKPGYRTVSRWSDPATVPVLALTATPAPTVTGSPVVGATLTAAAGTWEPSGVTLRYQWIRDGEWVRGATAQTYTLTASDAGGRMSVKVTGSKPGYRTVSRWSAAVGPVAP